MDVEKELKQLSYDVSEKFDDGELCLYWWEGSWSLDIGNSSPFVAMLEAPGIIRVNANSIEGCIEKAKKELMNDKPN